MVKEGAAKYSCCQKCTDQKKGCKWLDAKAIAKGEKPPSVISKEGLEKGKEKEQEPTKCETCRKSTTSQELAKPSIHVTPSRDQSLKRKNPDDAPAPVSQSQVPPHCVSIVVPQPRSCLRPRQVVSPVPPPSPTQSFDILDHSDFPLPSSSLSLGPLPSILGTSSSTSSSFTSKSLASLEIKILHSQLDAANLTLHRECEQIRQE